MKTKWQRMREQERSDNIDRTLAAMWRAAWNYGSAKWDVMHDMTRENYDAFIAAYLEMEERKAEHVKAWRPV